MKIYQYVIKDAKITSKFGYRIHPITGKKTFHNGLDLVSKSGNKNFYAIDDGYVQKVVNNQSKAKTGYGNYIWVRYPRYDLSLLHAHCSKVFLKKGDKVKKNDKVAYMGTTGASTGPHLHLGMTKIGSSTWLNPENYNMLPDKYNLTRILKKGCKGNDVKEWQKELIKRGYSCGKYGADGVFGNDTANSTAKYQKSKKLKPDKIVGKDTAHSVGWLFKGK